VPETIIYRHRDYPYKTCTIPVQDLYNTRTRPVNTRTRPVQDPGPVILLDKESYQTPHMDDYNKRHYSATELNEWYSEYLPFNIYDVDIPEEVVRMLNDRLREYETDSHEMFETNIGSAFEEFLVSHVNEELLEYLPQKPEPVDWTALSMEKKGEITEMVRECKDKGLTRKTIRKKLRSILESD